MSYRLPWLQFLLSYNSPTEISTEHFQCMCGNEVLVPGFLLTALPLSSPSGSTENILHHLFSLFLDIVTTA